ncbi:sulfurtransferase-like selenium metabolism protein YedF, partial [Dysosmobacter welbionis]
VVIHGGGRVVLIRLIQRHKEYVHLLFRQPLHALTHRGRFQEIQRHQQLVPGIGAVEVQRAVKAQLHRLVNEVDLLIPIAEQVQKLAQQHGTVREGIQVVQHFIGCPAFCRLAPNSYVEHLEHPLLQLTQRRKVNIVQTRQQVQQKADPAAGVHNGQPAQGFCKDFLQWFAEILDHIRPGTDAGEGRKLVNCPGIQVVIVQKICQGQ